MISQREIVLKAKTRGFHLVDMEILSKLTELKNISIGIANILIKTHPPLLQLMKILILQFVQIWKYFFNKAVPESEAKYYSHTLEGSDDITSHIKAAILGSSIVIPISNDYFNLGIWQGIYLCEHRNNGGPRKIIVTLLG